MRRYLKELRTALNMSQRDTAHKLCVSESYYNLLENGKRQQNMDLPLAEKLAQCFGVSVDYIIEQEKKAAKTA